MNRLRIRCLVDPDEWDDSCRYSPDVSGLVPTIAQGSRIEMEAFLDIGHLRSFGFRIYEPNEAGTLNPGLEGLGNATALCHFGGRALAVHRSKPLGASEGPNRGLIRLYVDLDCGVPACLGGLVAQRDPLLQSKSKWIEGVTTLWGNVSSPESPSRRTVDTSVESIRELDPVRLGDRELTYRILEVSIGTRSQR